MRVSYVFGVKEKTRLSLVAFVMLKTILPKRHKNPVARPLIDPFFLNDNHFRQKKKRSSEFE